jgi:hypothetical protein
VTTTATSDGSFAYLGQIRVYSLYLALDVSSNSPTPKSPGGMTNMTTRCGRLIGRKAVLGCCGSFLIGVKLCQCDIKLQMVTSNLSLYRLGPRNTMFSLVPLASCTWGCEASMFKAGCASQFDATTTTTIYPIPIFLMSRQRHHGRGQSSILQTKPE